MKGLGSSTKVVLSFAESVLKLNHWKQERERKTSGVCLDPKPSELCLLSLLRYILAHVLQNNLSSNFTGVPESPLLVIHCRHKHNCLLRRQLFKFHGDPSSEITQLKTLVLTNVTDLVIDGTRS